MIVCQGLIFMEIHMYLVPINTKHFESVFKMAPAQLQVFHYLSSRLFTHMKLMMICWPQLKARALFLEICDLILTICHSEQV